MYRLLALVAVVCLATAALVFGTGGDEEAASARRCPVKPASGPPRGFADVTKASGLDRPLRGMFAHAVAWGDANGDTHPDLFVGGFADYPLRRYRKRGARGPAPDRLLLGGPRGFRPAPGFPAMRGRSSGAAFADLDGDGDGDLVVARDTIPGHPRAQAPSVVLAGDGHGGFEHAARLPRPLSGRAVAVIDHDGDGRPDLFVTDDHYRGGASMLLRNLGGLRFADVTKRAGLARVQGLGAAAADLNGDGWTDLVTAGTRPTYSTAASRAARIFINRRDGTFREAGNAAFTVTTYDISDDMAGVAVGDVNGDARPDIVLGPHFESTEQYCRRVPVRLYLSRGGARFREVTGLPRVRVKSSHVEIEDMDGDGRPDILTTAPAAGGPAVLRNLGGATPRFAAPAGLGTGGRWGTGASADFDSDGRQDMFLTSFDPAVASLLLRNRSHTAPRLTVDVPVPGARVEIYRAGRLGDRGALLGVREITAGTGYGSGVPAQARFGLGHARRVDIRVTLPHGGRTIDRRGIPAGRQDFSSVAPQ